MSSDSTKSRWLQQTLSPKRLAAVYGIKEAVAAYWLPGILQACLLADITTLPRLRMFIAQVGHETGCLRFMREIWGPTAQQLRYEPVTQLSQRLGNVNPGDGKRYMGRGGLQTTGGGNYKRLTAKLRKLGFECPDFYAEPDSLLLPQYAMLGAAVFWLDNGLNRFADTGDFAGATKRINGGYNGLAHRQALHAKAVVVIC